ncbi:hypothetical protein M595_2070 [Lyngbya aestuarii BL J]|uniref:Uncharacterized protein n=1 Tax=Lyngbya aestuarii BL J TaxID=1348334 RepID=U7QKZ5_9CYAN|nr:hypothetical protein M595_2070 [Lyngbya aestuarii BL J]
MKLTHLLNSINLNRLELLGRAISSNLRQGEEVAHRLTQA